MKDDLSIERKRGFMINNEDFRKAVELISSSQKILLTTHIKPDGDACGSVVALLEVLRCLSKQAEAVFLSPVPKWYRFLLDEEPVVLDKQADIETLIAETIGDFDLAIVVDANSENQLPGISGFLKRQNKPVLIIDHHTTSDGLGTVEVVESCAAATGMIIQDLFRFADWFMTARTAEALFVAIATDTGWFQFNNTDGCVHRSCAELIEAGANPAKIYDRLYHNFTYERFKLRLTMLNRLELYFERHLAIQYLLRDDFEQTGAAYEDTENFINDCHSISTVKASALLVELSDGRIRCSLRSRGPDAIDVSKIAELFGGGGHMMAAGTYLPAPMEKAKQLILEQFGKYEEKLR